jgi:hypothetical protein
VGISLWKFFVRVCCSCGLFLAHLSQKKKLCSAFFGFPACSSFAKAKTSAPFSRRFLVVSLPSPFWTFAACVVERNMQNECQRVTEGQDIPCFLDQRNLALRRTELGRLRACVLEREHATTASTSVQQSVRLSLASFFVCDQRNPALRRTMKPQQKCVSFMQNRTIKPRPRQKV